MSDNGIMVNGKKNSFHKGIPNYYIKKFNKYLFMSQDRINFQRRLDDLCYQ
jgi:hypothetical protein